MAIFGANFGVFMSSVSWCNRCFGMVQSGWQAVRPIVLTQTQWVVGAAASFAYGYFRSSRFGYAGAAFLVAKSVWSARFHGPCMPESFPSFEKRKFVYTPILQQSLPPLLVNLIAGYDCRPSEEIHELFSDMIRFGLHGRNGRLALQRYRTIQASVGASYSDPSDPHLGEYWSSMGEVFSRDPIPYQRKTAIYDAQRLLCELVTQGGQYSREQEFRCRVIWSSLNVPAARETLDHIAAYHLQAVFTVMRNQGKDVREAPGTFAFYVKALLFYLQSNSVQDKSAEIRRYHELLKWFNNKEAEDSMQMRSFSHVGKDLKQIQLLLAPESCEIGDPLTIPL